MPKFSVIIPCYNSFKLMGKCLESLENQIFKDFEIIIIDDCSTDDSFEQLEIYKEKSNLNIILLKNDINLGPGKTRNNGINNATGEFVIFIDSDDYIEINTLEIMNKIIIDNNADCIIFDYYHRITAGTIKRKSLLKSNDQGIINKSDALIYSSSNTWGKVYLLKKIKDNKIEFPDLKRNEDLPFNKLAISVCQNIYYCNENLYNYVDNKDSLMHNASLLDENNAIKAFEILYDKLNEKYPKEIESIFLKQYLYATTVTLLKKGIKNSDLKKYIEDCEQRFPNLYKNEILKHMNKFQKIWIFAIRHRMFWVLRILLKLRSIIKKIGI